MARFQPGSCTPEAGGERARGGATRAEDHGKVFRSNTGRAILARDRMLRGSLPEEVVRDAQRQRFEPEAGTVAALDHPNIVGIYDVGDGNLPRQLVDAQSMCCAPMARGNSSTALLD